MTGKEILRKAPVIKASFAPEKVRYGDVLRIYIEAEASDGVMLRIASVVDQVGYGYYPTDWIYLKPEYQQHFRGFLQWNTSSSSAPYVSEWTQECLVYPFRRPKNGRISRCLKGCGKDEKARKINKQNLAK